MTSRTSTSNHTRMTIRRRCPCSLRVARIALQRRGVAGWLGDGLRAVVAGGASARYHTLMIERGRFPGGGGVTSVANKRSRNVRRCFAGRGGAVVAVCATTRCHAGMAERGGFPCSGAMTSVAR